MKKRGGMLRLPLDQWWNRWPMLGASVLGVVFYLVVDGGMRGKAPTHGFAPDSTVVLLTATNLPAFCKQAGNTTASQALWREFPDAIRKIETPVLIATGIRPTPSRWGLWMGARFLAAVAPEGKGFCIYPGLLVRGVEVFIRPFAPEREGVRRLGGVWYAWREGFLLAGSSEAYTRAALQSAPHLLGGDNGDLELTWKVEPHGRLRVRAEEGYPISGEMNIACRLPAAPLRFGGALPPDSVALIAAASFDDLLPPLNAMGKLIQRAYPGMVIPAPLEALAGVLKQPLTAVGVQEAVLLAGPLRLEGGAPVPGFAGMARMEAGTPDPFAAITANLAAVPFAWPEATGTVAPLLGDAVALCQARKGDVCFLASNEPLMNVLLAQPDDDPPVEAAMLLRVKWAALANAVSTVSAWAGSLELLPTMNAVESSVSMDALSKFLAGQGELVVTGDNVNGKLAFKGRLCGAPVAEGDG